MIDVAWQEITRRNSDERVDALVLNGKLYEESIGYDNEDEVGCIVQNHEAGKVLLNETISSLMSLWDWLEIEVIDWYETEELMDRAVHIGSYYFSFGAAQLTIVYYLWFGPGLRAQRNRTDFYRRVERIMERAEYREQLSISMAGDDEVVFEFSGLVEEEVAIMAAERCRQTTRDIISEVWDEIWEKPLGTEAVSRTFEFPTEIRSACQQYLIYFSQFLSDLGIEAETSLRQDAQRVLFTVMPGNPEEGLDKIREALEIYLSFPGNEHFSEAAATVNDIAVYQLVEEVYSLRSKLATAGMRMELQRATIEQLQLTNTLLRSKPVRGTQEDPMLLPKPADGEDILGGMLTIKPIDMPGVSANLPEIWRRFPELLRQLKRKWRGQ